jgi:hypothetical protein
MGPERARQSEGQQQKNAVGKQGQGVRSPATDALDPTADRASGRPITGWSAAEARGLDTVDGPRRRQRSSPGASSGGTYTRRTWRNTGMGLRSQPPR